MNTTDNQEEMFIVVDEKDKILGYRSRYDCHHDKTLIHRTIGVLIYDRQGNILLQKRSKTKDLDPGKWGVSVGGHVTKDQTNEEAARREMMEELGIDIPIEPVKKWIVRAKSETEMGMLYKAVYEGPFKFNKTEISAIRFFSKDDIAMYIYKKSVFSDCCFLTLKEVGLIQ